MASLGNSQVKPANPSSRTDPALRVHRQQSRPPGPDVSCRRTVTDADELHVGPAGWSSGSQSLLRVDDRHECGGEGCWVDVAAHGELLAVALAESRERFGDSGGVCWLPVG